MLTKSQLTQFERNGFLRIRNVFAPDLIRRARAFLTELFQAGVRYEGDVDSQCEAPGHGGRSVRFDVFARYPELRWVLTHPPLLAALRSLLGRDFVFLPDTGAHGGGFGRWHKDTHDQEEAGLSFHWEPDFRIVQVGMYLQDNTLKYGGGLDVIPGSHLHKGLLHPRLRHRPRWAWLRARFFGPLRDRVYPIPSRAGDLVVFHYRTEHRATWPTVFPVAPQHHKLAVFFACSANNRHVRPYVDFIHTQPAYRFLQTHRFPEPFLRAAREQQVTLL